ncbi:MAG: hypothetical protein WC107_02785 [Patescibacteria group bacterium]
MSTELDLKAIKELLDSAESKILQAKNLLFSSGMSEKAKNMDLKTDGKIIEGVFDGEKMVGPDGKGYQISANYASKSKLVTGDTLKLTILEDGSFVYKQIGPIKREKLIGVLEDAGEGKYIVSHQDKKYQVLPASVSYFKAQPGDQLAILVPEGAPTEWAAVENLIK